MGCSSTESVRTETLPVAVVSGRSGVRAGAAEFSDAVREGYRSTRIMRAHKHFIAVLNDVDYDTTRKRRLEVATLWVSADARCLLSVRTVPHRSVEQLRREVQAGHPFYSPMVLLIRPLQQQAEVMIGIGRSAAQGPAIPRTRSPQAGCRRARAWPRSAVTWCGCAACSRGSRRRCRAATTCSPYRARESRLSRKRTFNHESAGARNPSRCTNVG